MSDGATPLRFWLVRWADPESEDEYYGGSSAASLAQLESPLYWTDRFEATALEHAEARLIAKRARARGCRGVRVVCVRVSRGVRSNPIPMTRPT